ncbi:hypothetical protein Mal4_06130 [Maioricimonas rarisocia]|uniref:Lipoprotein n=1 Tax=Maioricimonas rarisocia TaxID=2528026 RepID=A0A517Z1I6_9PLAN|nr:hypothetical protein [Maioricimonas rarisocia]QDU36328.1 hypothetical protein Mal4_06130 [Maioricimonas rarisocia]
MTRLEGILLLCLAAVAGCDRGPRGGSSDAIESHPELQAPVLDLDPKNPQIDRFVDDLASLGYRLQFDADRSEWRSTEPVVEAYVIRLSIGAFPPDSSLEEMQRSLMAINLAYDLNPEAHLAMSEPGLVRLDSEGNNSRELLEALDSEPFRTARDELKQAFVGYRPAVP